MKIEVANKRRNMLGEGPHWDERSATLLYEDAVGCEIIRFDPETKTEVEAVRFGSEIGHMMPYADNERHLVVALGNGLYKFDMDTKTQIPLVETIVTNPPEGTRINDGKCDARGRLWAGTMTTKEYRNADKAGENSLYCYTRGELSCKMTGVTVSNGIAWTADNRTMFFNDTFPGRTYVFDFDVDAGTISNRRVLVDFQTTPGFKDCGIPDGMTTDVNDKIWMACPRAHCVLQIDPETAKILTKVKLPVEWPTSCCFGGKNYDMLYVTSANFGPVEAVTSDGVLLEITELGVKGRAPFEFAG